MSTLTKSPSGSLSFYLSLSHIYTYTNIVSMLAPRSVRVWASFSALPCSQITEADEVMDYTVNWVCICVYVLDILITYAVINHGTHNSVHKKACQHKISRYFFILKVRFTVGVGHVVFIESTDCALKLQTQVSYKLRFGRLYHFFKY